MDITALLHILAEESEEEGSAIAKAGFFADYMWIVGLVLAAVGLIVMYFGIKVGDGEVVPANLDSVGAMARFVAAKSGQNAAA